MKIILTLVSFLCLTASYAQINFEKGYFINNSNEKIDCYIKNLDWKSNPTEFTYKTTIDGEKATAEISTVKEFGVENEFKYQRYTVDIDRSTDAVGDLSPFKEPMFNREQLFLKVLVQGKASLYGYKDRNLKRYFYSKDAIGVTQLVYKNYKIDEFSKAQNTMYKQQLWNNARCEIEDQAIVNRVAYKKRDLVKYFVNFNTCSKVDFEDFAKNKNSVGTFGINLRPGFNSSSIEYERLNGSTYDTKYDNEIAFRIGVEFEFVMPFNKNKWSFIVEPTYQSFKAEKSEFVSIDYSSIEVPMGVRHYMYLNEKSKLFINLQAVLDFPNNSKLNYRENASLKLRSKPNLAFGFGYKYGDKFSIELRGHSHRNVLDGFVGWKSAYKTTSLILGYSIL
jgi:hypothetical protein